MKGVYACLVGLAVVVSALDGYTYCQAPPPTYAEPPTGGKLLQVLIVTRHGDRAPVNVFPNEGAAHWDCAQLETNTLVVGQSVGATRVVYSAPPIAGLAHPLWTGNCTAGMLTTVGISQHSNIGSHMRDIYIDKLAFLPRRLVEAAPFIFVRSTDLPRTRQSATAHIAAMFPNAYGGVPIEVHTAQAALEVMNPSAHGTICPRLAQAISQLKGSPEWTARQAAMQPVRQRLENACGTAGLANWQNWFDPYNDNLNCRWCHGIDLPVSTDDARSVAEETDWEMQQLMAGTDEILRLNIGFFVGGELVPFMRAAAEGKTAPKYLLFSAHDYTITALNGALGYKNDRWPPFASNIILELWQLKSGELVVRTSYNGEVRPVIGCSASPCPWQHFLALMDARATVHNATAECRLQ